MFSMLAASAKSGPLVSGRNEAPTTVWPAHELAGDFGGRSPLRQLIAEVLHVHLGAVQEEAVVGPRRPVHEAERAVGEADLVGPQEDARGVAHRLGGLLDLLHPSFLHRRLGRVDVVRLQPIDGQLAQVDEADGRKGTRSPEAERVPRRRSRWWRRATG